MGYTKAQLVGNALRDLHQDKVVDAVIADSYLLQTLERGQREEYGGGNYLEWLVDLRANTSYKATLLDGDDLPSSSNRKQELARERILNHVGTTGVTQGAIDSMTGGEASFYRVVDKAAKELTTDLRAGVTPQLYKQGLWRVANAVTADDEVELDNVQFIRVGERLTFGLVASPYTEVGTYEVVSKDLANKTVTLNTNVTLTTSHGAWMQGAGPGAPVKTVSFEQAATGLTTRVLHDIDSATYDEWRGNEVDKSGGAVSESDVSALANVMWERGAEPKEALTTAGIQTSIASTLIGLKRFNDGNSVKLNGGFTGIMVATPHGEIPVVAERNVPKGYLFMWDPSMLKYFRGDEGFLSPPDGRGFWRYRRSSSGAAQSAYEATFRMTLNLLWDNPVGAGMLRDGADKDPVW